MRFILLLLLCGLYSQCREAEGIKAFKVEIREVAYFGTCECHIRMDDLIEIGEDSITCYCYKNGFIDTLHYRKY